MKSLGTRGYSVKKKDIDPKKLNDIRTELSVIPYVSEDYMMTKPEPFKLYLESENKIYLPKYYGLKNFGIANINKIDEGDAINIEFTGKLRAEQEEPIRIYLEAAKNPLKMGGILNLPCAYGKCLGKDTPVMMYDGSIIPVQYIKKHDKIMGDDSLPRNILSVCQGKEMLYRIKSKNGAYVVNESHILSLKYEDIIIDIPLKEYFKLPEQLKERMFGYKVTLDFIKKTVEVDPYTIGCWLGNVKNISKNDNYIPRDYKYNSRNIRLNLLAGIIDSQNGYIIAHPSELLIDDIIYVSRSLGFGAYKIYDGANYKTTLHGFGLDKIPVKLKHKDIHLVDVINSKITIEQIGVGDYYGFTIDGNHRFLLGDFTVTHNTAMAIYIICELKKKTLIIVHKEFLLDQWKERISQFAPKARIGCIKGQIIDVKDKDIVIGSLQSLSMKDYDESVFKGFGQVVIDECFPFRQNIVTKTTNIDASKTSMSIGTIYNMWKQNEELPEVYSYNQDTKQFEWKKITYAWQKPYDKKLIRITFWLNNIKCTPNHKHLTLKNGMVESKNLQVGDLIISSYDDTSIVTSIAKALNDDQYQILLGSILGNGVIEKTESGRYKLKVTHNIEQTDYCKWKAYMFGVETRHINGSVMFNTKIIDFEKEIDLKWVIDDLDERGLAVWYMDNKLSIAKFDKDTCDLLIKKIKSFNINCMHMYCRLYFLNDDNNKLLNLIDKYMKFKDSYEWNNKFLNYGTQRISQIEYIDNNDVYDDKHVYDIEVEDNHTFICCSETNTIGSVTSNCHRIGAEVFSRALKKVNFKYSLGLSATVKRKDGLSKVFIWHIGDIVFKAKRKNDELLVLIKEYYDAHPDYGKEIKNYYNKLNIAQMVNNICDFAPRMKFVIDTLCEVLMDEPDRKVLLLSDRRNHLQLFKKELDERNITSGFCYGGLSQAIIEESQKQQVILGTYAYVSEGFDSPGLNTLILASPKSEMEQIIGRIQRDKPECRKYTPLVIDIVDNFSLFKHQAKKRLKYYTTRKYEIINDKLYDERKELKLNGTCILHDEESI